MTYEVLFKRGLILTKYEWVAYSVSLSDAYVAELIRGGWAIRWCSKEHKTFDVCSEANFKEMAC